MSWDLSEESARRWVREGHGFDASCPICSEQAHKLVENLLGKIDELEQRISFMLVQFDDFKAAAFSPSGKSWKRRYEELKRHREQVSTPPEG